MQIHATHGNVASGDLPVRLNPGVDGPFAIVRIGFAEIYLQDSGDCDRLTEAAAEARRLLTADESAGEVSS